MQNREGVLAVLMALACLGTPAAAVARTFYVNPITGSDSVFRGGAQNPSTPVKTVKRALRWAVGGDTVIVMVPSPPTPVALADPETIESKVDAPAGTLIVITCQVAGLCVWTPPTGTNGFFISHNNHVVDGFKVVGGNVGIRWGAHDGDDGSLFGGVIQNNIVENAGNNGIQCANCQGVEIAYNTVMEAGHNGIRYQGNSSVIHDNTTTGNAQFGIYVVDGVDHQVFANTATGNSQGQIQIAGSLLVDPKTYYVSAVGGNDARTPAQAQNPAMPWLTIQRGLNVAQAGDTVLVLPGTYARAESRRDGSADFPIVLRSSEPGGAIIRAGAASGLLIAHDHHTVDGFEVTGSANGIQCGPHELGDGVVRGIVTMNNIVHGNALAGIKFSRAQRGKAMHNAVYDNEGEGIVYDGSNGRILNNLVRGNGTPESGKYGLALTRGSGHQVMNNTVHGNVVGGLRLGTSSSRPVNSTVQNNIVTGNSVGVKEPGGVGYTGLALLDFNNVHGNASANYDLGPSSVGPNSISQPPGYVDAAGLDFRLGRVDTGQPSNSPCIDRGSTTADAVGLAGRTAFTDKSADSGPVDLGYHGTILKPSEATATVQSLRMSFAQVLDGDEFTLTARLVPAPDSDGLELGAEHVQIGLGALLFDLPVRGFSPQGGGGWSFSGPAFATTATLTKKADGSVDISVSGSGLNLFLIEGPSVSVRIRIGDDSGSAPVPVRGTLVYP